MIVTYLHREAAFERMKELRRMCAEMAEDGGLWFQAETSAEAYLQQELRKLCEMIERTA